MVQREPTALSGELGVSPNTGKAIRHKMIWDQWSRKPQRPLSHGSQTFNLCSKAGSRLGMGAE